MSKPVCIDLYCGLGGWTEGFLAEDYHCIGYDIEAHDYGTGGYPGELRLQDILTLDGAQFKDATCIVGSSPCQKYSYMAMPWTKAKDMAKWYRDKDHPERIAELNALFNAQFRIQREASAAAGKHIPMIIENVKGAQPWVGRAKANFGSFYLWGDVGMVGRRVVVVSEGRILGGRGVDPVKGHKVPGFRFDGSGGSFQSASVEAVKTPGRSMSKDAPLKWGTHNMGDGQSIMAELGIKNTGGPWFAIGSPSQKVTGQNPDGRKVKGLDWSKRGDPDYRAQGFNVVAAQRFREQRSVDEQSGIKQGGDWFGKNCADSASRLYSSKLDSRKAASAMIAKIPFPLANHVAKAFLEVQA